MELGQVINKLIKGNQSLYIHYGVVTAVTTEATSITTATGNVSTATKAVTLTAINTSIAQGMAITGANIQASTFVYSINGTDMVMTKVGASFSGAASLTFSSTRLSVKISGATTAITGIRYLESYKTPAINDVVVCLFYDNDVIVLGKLV